jgi:nitrous oxide reductase accessory protein NosL
MKKLLPIAVIVLLLAVVAVLFISKAKEEQPVTVMTGNTAMQALPIKVNRTNDPQCAMLLKSDRNAAEVAIPDGRTWFFDDPGCMVLWLEKKSFKDKAKLWVHTIDTERWVDAKKAHYGVTDHTAMHYGFGAREHEGNGTIGYEEMRLRMLRGENLTDPKIRKKLLGI